MNDINFEEAMTRIEDIVKELENDNIDLDKSLKLFQEGMELSNKCYLVLNNVEKQSIKILNDNDIEKIKGDLSNEQ
ncbi:MAG: exodeoxyribonuclease VII small subunit [Bacilli bacterium]|jgi:exodeoxyribonuclease VII small subunit|nr:exodeoxyribonuclease VII small subunit [Bacilli bacterium]